MIILLLPLFAVYNGIPLVGVGILLATRNAGTLLVNIPAGIAIQGLGENKTMLLCVTIVLLACVSFTLFHSIVGLAVSSFLLGAGIGGVALTRFSFISGSKNSQHRGRAMAKVAMVQRTGMLVGPLLGGIVVHFLGLASGFLVAAFITLLTLIICFFYLPKKTKQVESKNTDFENIKQDNLKKISLRKIIYKLPIFFIINRKILLTAGVAVMVMRLIRGAWPLLLPLWGLALGLNAATIGLAFSIASTTELLFIYFGGSLADKIGRKWVAIPSTCLLSIALLLLPLCDTLIFYIFLASLAGMAVGLGGGIIMTLGADFAPVKNRSTFLATWRLLGDLSGTFGPMLIAWIGSAFTLAIALIFSGATGLFGCMIMLFLVKETLNKLEQY